MKKVGVNKKSYPYGLVRKNEGVLPALKGNEIEKENGYRNNHNSSKRVSTPRLSIFSATNYLKFTEVKQVFLGGLLGFVICFIIGMTFIEEYLHAVPILMAGIPFIITETNCYFLTLQSLQIGMNWIFELASIFPYLFTFILGLGFFLIGSVKKQLAIFFVIMGITCMLISLSDWLIFGWHEYLSQLWSVI